MNLGEARSCFFIVGLCMSVYNICITVSQSLYLRGRIDIWKVLFENNAVFFQIYSSIIISYNHS